MSILSILLIFSFNVCVIGFFSGVTPAVVGIVPYMGLNFTLFEKFKGILASIEESRLLNRSVHTHGKDVDVFHASFLSKLLGTSAAGGAAGGISKIIVDPLGKRYTIAPLFNNYIYS